MSKEESEEISKGREKNKEEVSEDEFLDLDDIEEEEFKDSKKDSRHPKSKSNPKQREDKGNKPRSHDTGRDGYMMGEKEGEQEDADRYLKELEDSSGLTDFKKHRNKHGTFKDTGENFRRDYYDDDYKERKDKEEKYSDKIDIKKSNSFDEHQEENYARNKNKSKGYSLEDELKKYGGRDLLSEVGKGLPGLDDALRGGTSTGNKNVDRSLDALRGAIEYDIAKAVERDAERMINNKDFGRVPTERDFQRLEEKHKRKKAESLRKKVTTGIKTARTKENRKKFKAFMDSSEVKLALNLIGVFGGVYGQAFVKGVRIFTIIWSLNFGVVFLILMGIIALLGFVMVSAVFVVVMTLEEITEDGDEGIVEVGEEKTSSSVDVPAGYEGKFMFPVEKTRVSSRGYFSGHIGQDISGSSGTENVYPIYPGKVLLSGKDKAQCNNSGGSSCSTLRNPGAGIYFEGDGNAVQVAHDLGGGKYSISYYMHLAPNSIQVKEGQSVGYGTPLAKVGNSGNSYGAHLHVEIYDGVPKGFFESGKAHYKTDYNWYYKLTAKTIAPPPLWTCGGKSGVAVNSSGQTTTPQSCVDDAVKARNK